MGVPKNKMVLVDGSNQMEADLNLGGNKLTNSGAPSDPNDLATKTYVDSVAGGGVAEWRKPVDVDGLVGNATVATINGLTPNYGDAYVVTDSGTINGQSAAAGDIYQYTDEWSELISNVGGYPPDGTRAIVAFRNTDPIAPYTGNKGIVVQFDGTSLTGANQSENTGGSIIMVDGGAWVGSLYRFESGPGEWAIINKLGGVEFANQPFSTNTLTGKDQLNLVLKADGGLAIDTGVEPAELYATSGSSFMVEPVYTISLVGNTNIAGLNGAEVNPGDSFVCTEAGTPSAGESDTMAIGDLAEWDGTQWKKLAAGSGGFVANGVRAALSTQTSLISPYVNGTDDGKIVSFDGTSLTGVDTGDTANGVSTVVSIGSASQGFSVKNAIRYTYGAIASRWLAGSIDFGAGGGLVSSEGSAVIDTENADLFFGGGNWQFPTDVLQVTGTPNSGNDAVNKTYADTKVSLLLPRVDIGNLKGTLSISGIDALGTSATPGDGYIVSDTGTPSQPGSGTVYNAGELVEWFGVGRGWQVMSISGGSYPQAGIRAIITSSGAASPYIGQEGDIVQFSGSSLTGVDTGETANGFSVSCVTSLGGYWNKVMFTYYSAWWPVSPSAEGNFLSPAGYGIYVAPGDKSINAFDRELFVSTSPLNFGGTANGLIRYVYLDTTSTAITVNLPNLGTTGTRYKTRTFKLDVKPGSNNVTIIPNASDTIDGASSYTLSTVKQFVTLHAPSTGTDWKIVGAG